jgi:hypothetical protein
VLEYSELDPATASATNPATGKLFYNWSNICMHYFALSWLKAAAQHLRSAAVYHIAHKQIPAKGGVKVPGLKLEMFIFDPFCTADKTTLFEVSGLWCLSAHMHMKGVEAFWLGGQVTHLIITCPCPPLPLAATPHNTDQHRDCHMPQTSENSELTSSDRTR